MAEMNFMDVFFGSGFSIPPLAKETKVDKKKDDGCLEWISDDFLDSILKSCTESTNPLIDQFLNHEHEAIDSFMECSSDDSGVSHGIDRSPSDSIKTDDELCLSDPLLQTDHLIREIGSQIIPSIRNEENMNCDVGVVVDSTDYIKEEEVECEEVLHTVYVVANDNMDETGDAMSLTEDENDDLFTATFSSDNSSTSSSKKEDCQAVGNISRARYKRSKIGNYSHNQRLRNKRKFSSISEGTTSDDSDCVYPPLYLTSEEQNLAVKEGIKLPTHYPLTKAEERELKRIRRKIRNKISAQDSRRRKKEYVDGLEERVKQTAQENAKLLKRIKTLEDQRLSLVTQVKKLQASLARCYSGQSSTQPSTCLMVLLMSMALILAPSTRNSFQSSESTDDEGISLSEDNSTPRNTEMLSTLSKEANILEQLQKMQLPIEGNALTSILEIFKLAKLDASLKEHDYFRPRKRTALGMDDSDAVWSPSKMVSQMATQLKNISSVFSQNKKAKVQQRTASTEPVIIDLSD